MALREVTMEVTVKYIIKLVASSVEDSIQKAKEFPLCDIVPSERHDVILDVHPISDKTEQVHIRKHHKEDDHMAEYRDQEGTVIHPGDTIMNPEGVVKIVHVCMDYSGKQDLGILATSETYLKHHPDSALEFYSLNQIEVNTWVIIDTAK